MRITPVLYNILPRIIRHLRLPLFKKRSIDLAILIDQVTANLKIAKVKVERAQPKINDVDHRAYALSEKEVIFHPSLDLAELMIPRVRRSEREEDHLVKMTKIPNAKTITIDALIRQTEPPFTERVRVRVSSRFKLPYQLGVYEGKIDPMDHLDSSRNLMLLQGYSDETKADKYISTKVLAEAKRRRRGRQDHKRKKPDIRRVDYRDEVKSKRLDSDTRRRANGRRPHTPPHRPNLVLLPLNTSIAQVLMEIKNEEFV
ncbi:hypothetical protein Acr_00g0011710 [Actinidia rufa]|uniref:Uncharacterized protein n=1 Tax=Actinidia rufa TaxID=165716 RepID=A0A7J0D9I9_9ERIC|nr:hypothetical protein Acr_00g0011710 [Actinidia rufa]